MSVFRVKLQNTQQGLLDKHPTTGVQNTTSVQRTVYITGPNRTHRQLVDGATFTDSNYYKRYAYPQVALADAILEVVTDDGSVYSDVDSENTFPVVQLVVAAGGSTWSDNQIDILGDYNGHAVFAQLTNMSTAGTVRVRLNGAATAIFDLEQGDTQVFNAGDLSLSMLEFENTESGSPNVEVQVILSVKSVSNS